MTASYTPAPRRSSPRGAIAAQRAAQAPWSSVQCDQKEIARALRLILEPGQVTELRILGRGSIGSGYFDNVDTMATEAKRLGTQARTVYVAQTKGIYFIPNPVNPALLARAANRLRGDERGEPATSDKDIIRRRWLLVDIDPVRPAGISSSDEEHQLALDRARLIAHDLAEEDWPEPLISDSGNGAQLMYHIDLSVDDGGLVQRCLQALALRFDDDRVIVDQTTFNPARIWKLPGTWARKGDSTAERPHRRARLVEAPEPVLVARGLLEALTRTLPPPSKSRRRRYRDEFDLERWMGEHAPDAVGPTPWGSGRRWIFPICPWNADHTNHSAGVFQLAAGGIAARCQHNGCAGNDWASLRDLLEPGRGNGRERWEEPRPPSDDDIPADERGFCEPDEPTLASGEDSGWEEPIPLDYGELPPFPSQVLPVWLQAWVEELATATQTPLDLAGMLSLAVCGAAVARRFAIRVMDGWEEPLNIYTLPIMRSGTRKSAVFKEVTRPLSEWESEAVELAKREVYESQSLHRVLKEELARAERRAAQADGEEREKAEEDVKRLARGLVDFEATMPVMPRLIADDVTPERLGTLLAEQGERIAVMAPEGDLFDLISGRYSKNAAPNFDIYLRGHAGDEYRVDRGSRPPVILSRPAITLALAAQPAVLQSLGSPPAFRGKGLLARLLPVLPSDMVGFRDVDAPSITNLVRNAYRDGVRALLAAQPAGDSDPEWLTLSVEAEAELREFRAWLEPELLVTGSLGHIADWGSKLPGALVRLGGILHFAETIGDGDRAGWRSPVPTMAAPITLGHYLIPHAKAAFGEMGVDPALAGARRLVEWIRDSGCSTFKKRDAFSATRSRATWETVASMEPALEVLEERGYVRERPPPVDRGRGRPSEVYDVNPAVHASSRVAEPPSANFVISAISAGEVVAP